ncbi:MAG: amidohydrolase family protein [Candidatus Methanofastidiosia archaeon]|jgi:guanine deaminase
MGDLIFAHAALIPMIDENHYLYDGAFYIHNSKIVEVARTGVILEKYSGEVINLDGKLVTPPFLNAHHHLYQTGISKPCNGNLLSWLANTLFMEEPLLDKKTISKNALIDCKNFLKSGVGYLILQESHLFYETIIEAIKKCKIKSLIGRYCGDNTLILPDNLCESPEESVRKIIYYRQKYKNSNYVHISLSPRFLPAVTPDFLKYIKEHIQKIGPFFQIHFNESKNEIKLIKGIHHKESAEVLTHYGLLHNETILPHSIYLTERELLIIKQKKPIITTSPSTNLLLSGNVTPIAQLLAKSIPIGLGLDSYATSKSKTYFQELYALPSIIKEFTKILIPKILISSAKIAFTIFGGGILKPGSWADFVIFDVKPRNPWEYIVNHFSPENIESIILNGEIAYENK